MKEGRTGEQILFEGFAEDHENAIGEIQLSLDGGSHWTSFPTQGATSDRLVHWTFSFTPERPGRYRRLARSGNSEGKPSPLPSALSFEVRD